MSLLLLLEGEQATPQRLFQDGTVGAIYDYDSFDYLYQKSDGSVPVTALEQPVGLMLDKSRGLALGVEKVSNGDFSSDSWWSKDVGVSIAGGACVFTGVTSSRGVYRNALLSPRALYEVRYTISAVNSGSVSIFVGGNSGAARSAAGTYVERISCGSTTLLGVFASPAFDGSIDNISVREIAGLHAYQSTDAARPVISARYNLLLNTVFAGAVAGTPGTAPTSWAFGSSGGTLAVNTSATDAVLTFSATAARHFIGQAITAAANTSYTFTATVNANNGITFANILNVAQALAGATVTRTLNGAVATGNETPAAGDTLKVVLSVAGTGGTATFRLGAGCDVSSTGSVSLSKPDLRLTIDANPRLPSYQRVTTATDYDSAGFPRFLRRDATDDFLQTASVDPGTDKVFVCSGVTKMTDAATAVLVESSTVSNTTAGTFAVFAPGGPGAATYGFRSRGSVDNGQSTAGSYASPASAVLSGIGNIAGDSLVLRVNGVEAINSTADQGTGNYTAQPIYIGMRAGSSLGLNNGRIYPMVICFKAVTAGEIAATEAWVNQRTRAY